MTRRNKLEILSSILNLCKAESSSKTKIVYAVNLNFKNAGLYIEWLTQRGYLEKSDKIYKTTDSGCNLLKNLEKINDTINEKIK
jgi:predicted transcriptional regulator